MMRAAFTFLFLWLALMLELLAGQLGLPLLLVALVIYYALLTTSTAMGFAIAIAAGILIDLIYGRTLPVTPVILAAALLTGRLIHLKEPTHPLETALPGMGIALVAILGNSVARLALSTLPGKFNELIWELIFFGAVGLVIMPVLTIILDGIGRKLGLDTAIQEPKSNIGALRPRRVREPRKAKRP